MRFSLLIILCLLIFQLPVGAQEAPLSNLRSRHLLVKPGVWVLDSLPVIPHTLYIRSIASGQRIDTSLYELKGRELHWLSEQADSLVIEYRVLPYPLDQSLSRLDTNKLNRTVDNMIVTYEYNPYEQENPLVDFKGLDYSGSFSRGISFGNNQDLVLNSSFNLQMAGEIGDGIELLAAITDENIPLQAEGNTQQLREFDKVFIQLKKGKTSLTAGDYELRRPNGYFMNYFKKLQGATFENTFKTGEKGSLYTKSSVAVARGQFARNAIVAQEGNQGPYKLRGTQNERFIIILSGTEKVWLDGQLLNRGLEADYIIDYNRGELTFTYRRLITKDSRIIIEFDYSDQNYLRSMYATNLDYQQDKLRLYFNAFSQQDSKNATGDLQLSDGEKLLLSQIGDQFSDAFISTIDTLEGNSELRATYELRDTTINCANQDSSLQYLVYSTDLTKAKYVARFTQVGLGNGLYTLDTETSANERVYKWVGIDPLSCQPLGDYEPIANLSAPLQQQLFTGGFAYRFSEKSSLTTELALSRRDLNRFSRRDDGDNNGLAVYTHFDRDFQLGSDSSGWLLQTNLSYEFTQSTFQPLNPYRSPEFLRDWNIANVQGQGTAVQAAEQIGKMGLKLNKANWGNLSYGFSGFLRESLYDGLRHEGGLLLKRGTWTIDGKASYLETDEVDRQTRFFRPNLSITKRLPWLDDWQLGWAGEREKSERLDGLTDTLLLASFYYDRYSLFLESPEKETYQLGLKFNQRKDFSPQGKDFQHSTTASELVLDGDWKTKGTKNRLRIGGGLTYRELDILRADLSPERPAETYLGRTDVNISLFKGAIQSNSTYNIGSGQEPKIEYTYAQVRPGSGTHIWLDSIYNNDGKIQEFEMEVAPFQDLADYIRISNITDEFIRTDNVSFNQSLRINPRAIWFNKKDLKKWLSRWSGRSNLQINRKTRSAPQVRTYDPFQFNISDTALVSLRSTINNSLFFNQSDPTYGFQLTQKDNRSRVVQTSGYESRRLSDVSFQGRWNLSSQMSTRLTTTFGKKESDSEFFSNRDYLLRFWQLEPEFTFQKGQSFRTILRYKYQEDRNIFIANGEAAQQHDLSLETVYKQRLLSLKFSYIDVTYDGQPSSPAGLAILNGLQQGQNFIWNLSLNRQLAKNVLLVLSYEGRKTGTSRVIHVGRAQVAATF
ncbi:MAG: hypothetical protein R2828_18750 [Saprospiraceae bacterium]